MNIPLQMNGRSSEGASLLHLAWGAARWTICFCAACFIGVPMSALERDPVMPVVLTAQTAVVGVGRALEYYEDKSAALSFEAIVHDSSLEWQRVPADKPSFGFTRSAYWFRFTVQNMAFPLGKKDFWNAGWLVEMDYPPLDHITFYAKDTNGKWDSAEMGDQLPFSARQIQHRNYIVPLMLDDTLPHQYYLKIITESSLQVPLTVYRNQEFASANTRFDMFYGSLFGTMLTLIAYNLVLFFTMRVPSYLFFVLYMIGAASYFASISGYAQYIVGDIPWLANRLTLAVLFVAYAGLAFFGRLFLQTSRYAPLLDKMHLGSGFYGLIGIGLSFVLPYRINAIIASVLVLFVTMLCLVSGVIILRRGNRSALNFLVALAAFLVSALAALLRNVGLVPSGIFTVHGVEIGSAIEGVLFSFALSSQYRSLKKQKETAQREALRLQQEANERLEEKVKARTLALEESNREIQRQLGILDEQSREIELANTTLNEKNIQLEDLNREKNEFLGIAAHDLKNPLSAITMSASIVLSYRDKITNEQLEERLRNILQTSERMMEIIKNLLDVNAIESGQFQFTVERVDIREILSGLVDEYRDRAEAKSITLHYENHAQATFVVGDKTALTEIFENLISNAVKYSPHQKQIHVKLRNTYSQHSSASASNFQSPNLSNVCIVVQDEGPGLSDEDKKKLFGKFARLSARPTGGEHSTGLGLSIVKKMVEAMHGRVWCESELGQGARFIVELPTP